MYLSFHSNKHILSCWKSHYFYIVMFFVDLLKLFASLLTSQECWIFQHCFKDSPCGICQMITLSCQYWIDLILCLDRISQLKTVTLNVFTTPPSVRSSSCFICQKFSAKFNNVLLIYLHDRRHHQISYVRFSLSRTQNWWVYVGIRVILIWSFKDEREKRHLKNTLPVSSVFLCRIQSCHHRSRW